jgi:hypothetical protein
VVVVNSHAVPVPLREDIMGKGKGGVRSLPLIDVATMPQTLKFTKQLLVLIAPTTRAEHSSVKREMGMLVARTRLQVHEKKRKAVRNTMLRRSSHPTSALCGNSNSQVTPQKRRKQREHMCTGELLFKSLKRLRKAKP